MAADPPVFGIFGHHDSGKTTLIEQLMPRLSQRGLSVAVAKVHGSRIQLDTPGKDSDRLYRAGADVFLQGKTEAFLRLHGGAPGGPSAHLARLARQVDLVLVEGRKRVDCDKLWLLAEGETGPPPDADRVVAALPRGPDRADEAWRLLQDWLARRWLATPVFGCVLIGGGSTRMGRPKHLIETAGRTWLQRTVAHLRPHVARVAIVGAGDVPASLADLVRLPDVTEADGPMAGLLSAMRWAPHVSYLVAACDLPDLRPEALAWLLSTRAPGVWATLPRLAGGDGVEPLLAHYDFRACGPLEALAAEGRFSLSRLAEHPKVISPAPPADLAPAWRNVNTPTDLPGS